MSSNAHLFCFSIALNELKWVRIRHSVPKLVMVWIVQNVKSKRLLKMGEQKIIDSSTIVKCALTVLWRNIQINYFFSSSSSSFKIVLFWFWFWPAMGSWEKCVVFMM